MNATVTYRSGNDLPLDDVLAVYAASSLGERRPLDDRERMRKMLANANLVISAWDGPVLVGLARALTDFSYCTYLSDLTIRESHQRRGIGRELVRRVQAAGGPGTTVILLSAPQAVDYYPRIGFRQHPSGWFLYGDDPVR